MDVGEYIRKKEKMKSGSSGDVKKYTSMNEEQLIQELFRVANASNVSNEELDSFFQKASPYLTPEQREKMKGLILQLKR